MTVVSHYFGFVFVDIKSNFCIVSGQFPCFTLYVYVAVSSRDIPSSSKSMSPNDSVNVHMTPFLTHVSVIFTIQYIASQNRNGYNIHPCFTPVLMSNYSVKCWPFHLCLNNFMMPDGHYLVGNSVMS